MKKNKGFTLIELLAIIVILVIIAVITVPIILNVIDNSRVGTIKDSIYGYKDAINKFYMLELYKNGNFKLNGTYRLTNKGELIDSENTYVVPFSGNIPSGGNLTYENNILKNGCITMDEYKVIIEDGEVKTLEKGNCSLLKCVRSLDLHEEQCNRNNGGCRATGYYEGGSKNTNIIKYGNPSYEKGKLNSGDVFNCDINGDGEYNSETERFYYVSDLYNTTDNKFDNNYATLIYYNDVKINDSMNVVPDDSSESLIIYDNGEENWHGPRRAINNLPTINEWNNISLSNNTRKIITEINADTTTGAPTTLPTFNYEKEQLGTNIELAARLLTTQELEKTCGITVGSNKVSELDTCIYLLENTKYSDNSKVTWGYWLETPRTAGTSTAWLVRGENRNVNDSLVSREGRYGVRPVIEILKTDIEL